MKSKIMAVTVALAFALVMVFAITGPVAAAPPWDVSGTWDITVVYQSVPYNETLVLTQSETAITGVSLNTNPPVFASSFVITGGSVSGDTITFTATYGPNPSESTAFSGTIASASTMTNGTWQDNPNFLNRTGTWSATLSTANILGTVVAPSVSVTAPGAVSFGQFKFGVPDVRGPDQGTVNVTLGSATTVNWSVAATDAAYGNGYMSDGTKLLEPLMIGADGNTWVTANSGGLTYAGTNTGNFNFYAKQTVSTLDGQGTYTDTIVFSATITSSN